MNTAFPKKTPCFTQASGLIDKFLQGLLRRGFECLETGGRLVYSTCSLNPIVPWALKRHNFVRPNKYTGCSGGTKSTAGFQPKVMKKTSHAAHECTPQNLTYILRMIGPGKCTSLQILLILLSRIYDKFQGSMFCGPLLPNLSFFLTKTKGEKKLRFNRRFKKKAANFPFFS